MWRVSGNGWEWVLEAKDTEECVIFVVNAWWGSETSAVAWKLQLWVETGWKWLWIAENGSKCAVAVDYERRCSKRIPDHIFGTKQAAGRKNSGKWADGGDNSSWGWKTRCWLQKWHLGVRIKLQQLKPVEIECWLAKMDQNGQEWLLFVINAFWVSKTSALFENESWWLKIGVNMSNWL